MFFFKFSLIIYKKKVWLCGQAGNSEVDISKRFFFFTKCLELDHNALIYYIAYSNPMLFNKTHLNFFLYQFALKKKCSIDVPAWPNVQIFVDLPSTAIQSSAMHRTAKSCGHGWEENTLWQESHGRYIVWYTIHTKHYILYTTHYTIYTTH